MPRPSVGEVIETLQLVAHPEGGYYREIHRSSLSIGVPPGYAGERSALTAIYFLLTEGDYSAWHRVRSEEVWIHLDGDPLQLVIWGREPQGYELGAAARGHMSLRVVPPGALQAAHSLGKWSLVTCLVAPGFEFEDFDLPSREVLLRRFPEHKEWIVRYTRR